MIKLVVTDLDGTLFNESSVMSDENIAAIRQLKANHIQFGIASGRSADGLIEIVKANNIEDCVTFVIGFNGVTMGVIPESQRPIARYLSKEIIQNLVRTFEHEPIAFAVHEGNQLIASAYSSAVSMEQSLNDYGLNIYKDFASFVQKDYPKLMFVGEAHVLDDLDEQVAQLRGDAFHSCRSHANFLEILAKGVSKGDMLSAYCQQIGIQKEEVLALGDNSNDIEMVSFAKYGIAMANAVPALKAVAYGTTDSNNENGFAKALNQYIFDQLQ